MDITEGLIDRAAFDTLVQRGLPQLRGVVRRMIGHPEDTDDVVQEALLKAWTRLDGFARQSSFGTWLCAIGTRAAIDHLRRGARWRERAQVAYSNACLQSEELGQEVMETLGSPEHAFSAKEHIAYCFSCVGRSLPPEQQAALVLRDVLGWSNAEAAVALEMSEPVLRHTLSDARRTMTTAFEGLCSLVNKDGVCYQCKGLREASPPARRGDPAPAIHALADRLLLVRAGDIDVGASQAMHDLFWRRTAELEERGEVSDLPEVRCGED